ncbi:MAG: formylglycine-generating enzyme family protein, partial [Planctomycetota bacterium]
MKREALSSNPLLNFDRLLLIKRKPLDDPRRSVGDQDNDKGVGRFLGLPQQSSWQLHTMNNTDGWENEISILSPVGPEGKMTTLYVPPDGRLVSEMDLHFDAEKLMFSMPDSRKHWQIYELGTDGANLKQLSPQDQRDVHNFDSCYLPNGRIAFISTAPFQGVPCNAGVNVGMSYIMDGDGGNIRQVCFEQDHNFCPTAMNDGRILYLRWEYTDIPHVWARFLFTMNPDGTSQREFYGSGGYWPNAIFWARPIPDHPTKVVGIVTGHHVGRVGELVVFDPALGRISNQGVVQRIPGYGKPVEPLIEDKLTLDTWPKFLHPWPLSEKYFIVACKPRPTDLWGIYLVDVFDNVLLLKELEGYALLEPVPLRKTEKPPVIVDRVDLTRDDALVFLEDIYKGPGLAGIPRGAVKKLRLFTYYFGYHTVAGINHRVGTDGPWEPKRILGTVPVEEDGSALFRV